LTCKDNISIAEHTERRHLRYIERTEDDLAEEEKSIIEHVLKEDFSLSKTIVIKFESFYKNMAVYKPIGFSEAEDLDNIVIAQALQIRYGSGTYRMLWVSAEGVVFVEPIYSQKPRAFISAFLTPSAYINTRQKKNFDDTIRVIEDEKQYKKLKKGIYSAKKVRGVASVDSDRHLATDKEGILYEGFTFGSGSVFHFRRKKTDLDLPEGLLSCLDRAQHVAARTDPIYTAMKKAEEPIMWLKYQAGAGKSLMRYQ
jgi:hypothetical protein